MNVSQDKTKAPAYYSLAEKRAYMAGWRAARSGIRFAALRANQPGIQRRWPNAYAKGYWNGYAAGPYDGCELAYERSS